MFIGELFPHDDETLVNHKVIPTGLGKFKIKTVFASRILAWQKYDPDIHCRDSFIIWSKLETRKTRQHEILKPNVAWASTISNWVTEVDNGCGRKIFRHDAVHLSSKRKKRRDCGLNYNPRKAPRKFRKELRNPCPMVWRKKCQTLISQDKRQEIFQSYWKIGNVQGQWQFIKSNITIKGKSRTRTNVSPQKSRRQNRRVFRLDGKEVCKVMFLIPWQ